MFHWRGRDGFYCKEAKKYNYVPRTGISEADFTYQLENGSAVHPAEELQCHSSEEEKQGYEAQYPQKPYRQRVAVPNYICGVGNVGKNE